MLRVIGGLLAFVVAILMSTYPEAFDRLTSSDLLACATFAVCAGVALMGSEFSKTMMHRN